MGDRILRMIIQMVADRKSSSEFKKLETHLDKLHQSISKIPPLGPKISKGANLAVREIAKIRKELTTLQDSFKSLGKLNTAAEMTTIAIKIRQSISKIIDAARRMKKEFGGLARGSIDDFEKLASEINPLIDSLLKIGTSSRKAAKDQQKLGTASRQAGSSIRKLASDANIGSSGINGLGESSTRTAESLFKLGPPIDSLEAKLRNLQALGTLKGVLNFQKDIASIKTLQKEMERLRSELSLLGSRAITSKFGVTEGMITSFRKAQVEVEKLKTALTTLPEQIGKLQALENKFLSLSKTQKDTVTSLTKLIQKHKELGTKGTSEVEKIAAEYSKLRESIVSNMQAVGISHLGAIRHAETFGKKLQEAMLQGGSASERLEATVRELEHQYKASVRQMVDSTLNFARTTASSFNKASKDLAAQEKFATKLGTRLKTLVADYNELAVSVGHLGRKFMASSEGMKMTDSLLLRTAELSKILTGSNRELVSSIEQNILAFRAEQTELVKLTGYITSAAGAFNLLEKEEKELEAANRILTNSEILLSQRIAISEKKTRLYADQVRYLSKQLRNLQAASKGASNAARLIEKELVRVAGAAKLTAVQIRKLKGDLAILQSRGGDAMRSLGRMTVQGFSDMIVSQAAWMAGFQIIFGTLDKFKAALGSIIELQKAVVSAMRAAEGEGINYARTFERFSEVIGKARTKTGMAFEDLGQIMYELASAGLKADEAIAAFNSTLLNIVGTEADVALTTRLVAGLYNNFAIQIVKVNGEVKTISNTTKFYNDELVETANLQEKFLHINDLLVSGFRKNQVEVNELRDGLKFMAQSGKLANLTLQDQIGILSFLNNHLIKAGTAGRALRVIFSKISRDAKGFKEAFDLRELDLTKPLDFLAVLDEIGKKYSSQKVALEEIGKIFKRMGLRGAEAFAVLVMNSDKLRKTIDQVGKDAKNASERIAEIKLSSLAEQAKIASANLEKVFREGLKPLYEISKVITLSFNSLSEAMGKFDEAAGNALTTFLKFVGGLLTLGIVVVLFKNFGNILNWVFGVYANVGKSIAGFGFIEKEAGTAVTRLTGALHRQGIVLGKLGIIAKKTTIDMKGAAVGMGMLEKASIRTGVAIKGLAAIWRTMTGLMKGVAIIAVITVIMEIINRMDEWAGKIRDHIDVLEKEATIHDVLIAKYEGLSDSIQKAVGNKEEESKMINKLLREVPGLTAKYYEQENALGKMNEELKRMIQLEEELMKFKIQRQIEERIKLIEYETLMIKRYGDASINTWGKIEFWTNKISRQLQKLTIMGPYLKYAEMLKNFFTPALEKLGKKADEASSKIGKIKGQLEAVRNLLSSPSLQLGEEVKLKGMEKKLIEDLARVQKEFDKIKSKIREVRIEQGMQAEEGSSGIRKQAEELEKLKDETAKFEKEIKDVILRQKELSAFSALFKSISTNSRMTMHSLREFKDEAEFSKAIDSASILVAKIKETTGSMNNLKTNTTENKESFIASMVSMQTEAVSAFGAIITQIQKLGSEIEALNEREVKLQIEGLKGEFDILAQEIDAIGDIASTASSKMELGPSPNDIANTRKLGEEFNKFLKARGIEIIKVNASQEAWEKKAREISDEEGRRYDLMKKFTPLYESQITNLEKQGKAFRDIYEKESESLKETLKIVENKKLYQVDYAKAARKALTEVEASKKALQDELGIIEKQRIKRFELIDILEKGGKLTQSQAMTAKVKVLESINAQKTEVVKMINDRRIQEAGLIRDLKRLDEGRIKNLEEAAMKLAGAIEKLPKKLIDIGFEEGIVEKFSKEIDEMIARERAPIVVKIQYEESNKPPETKYFGGRIGGRGVPTRVSAGEGFIPAQQALGNVAVLNALNSGNTVSRVPSGMSTFRGPGGVDNIPTYLPSGSYVLSHKGVEAYERSISDGAKGFAQGGEVADEESAFIATQDVTDMENMGSMTFVIQKDSVQKEFSVYGRKGVLKELREELDNEKLTRLH